MAILIGTTNIGKICYILYWAGFTTGESTWLPVNENYVTINVAAQEAEQTSHLNIDRDLIALRKTDTVRKGKIVFPEEFNSTPESLVFFR